MKLRIPLPAAAFVTLGALLFNALANAATSQIVASTSKPTPRAVASTDWTETQTISAAEATQAAAATTDTVYAISSTHVARYDRATGQRTGLSHGKASHLNSGFILDGRLYCAHSNYPKKPERSEIMVMDLTTLELTTFKEFGNFAGSLTWAIYHDDAWWCNFAHYGDENRQTVLVKFDKNWQEIRRWTYPEELFRSLGKFSLSGGIWRDGFLYVTGHDEPVTYKLRVPETGSVLQLVVLESVPFNGQGIASDPATGGLVGIRRSEKRVVFASQKL